MRRIAHAVAATILALGLAGCLRPLYGSPEFNGLSAQQGLAGVAINVDGDRLAHYLRNELEFGLRGGNSTAAAPTHQLTVAATTRTVGAIVDRITGVAESASLIIEADYTLRETGKSVAVNQGKATVVVSYERSAQRFANVRAARDAEIQGARQLADQIRGRVASYLATR
jgi:LPS-assembly lipoprotein